MTRSAPTWLTLLALLLGLTEGGRNVRYVEFSPPVVHPQQEHVTVQARQDLSLSCEGHKPVSWQLPQDTARNMATR